MTPTRGDATRHLSSIGRDTNYIIGYIDGIDNEESQDPDNKHKEYSAGYSLGRNTLDISNMDEHLYNIFDGDGLNPVYITDGLWYYPDGSSRDDKD